MDAAGPTGMIVGQDYSEEMLEAAKRLIKKNGWSNITLIAGDAAELDAGKTEFDGVLSVLGVSAVPDWEDSLQRCFDVLKTGGRLVVCDARPFHGWRKLLNPLVRFVYAKFAAWDPTKDIPQKMREIFGNVETASYNFGTFFIAISTKR